jgi:hypothetical protein
MAMAIQQISPVAHLPLVLGVVHKLNVAALLPTVRADACSVLSLLSGSMSGQPQGDRI